MNEAMEILRAALDRCDEGPQTGPDVRLALKALRFAGMPADPIRQFWEAASGTHGIGRSQGMYAALNRIERFRTGQATG